jgi:hypothetical protein
MEDGMVAQFVAASGNVTPLVQPHAKSWCCQMRIECPDETVRIQKRDSMVQVLIQRVVKSQ